jgi:hypothetical protein
LNGRAAHAAGDATEALYAGAIRHHRVGDEAIPGFSCAHVEENFSIVVVSGALIDAGDRHLQNEPRPAGVSHDEIAAAAQNKEKVAL